MSILTTTRKTSDNKVAINGVHMDLRYISYRLSAASSIPNTSYYPFSIFNDSLSSRSILEWTDPTVALGSLVYADTMIDGKRQLISIYTNSDRYKFYKQRSLRYPEIGEQEFCAVVPGQFFEIIPNGDEDKELKALIELCYGHNTYYIYNYFAETKSVVRTDYQTIYIPHTISSLSDRPVGIFLYSLSV